MPNEPRPLYTSEVLRDIHTRSHENFKQLLEHCRVFTEEELAREMEGFGDPSIRHHFHHVICAEKYWVSVIQGRMDVDEDDGRRRTIDEFERYRAEVFASADAYLRGASPEELSTPRPMMTWGGHERVLVPALIVTRTLMHLYHHQGKILAMCRLLGKPGEGMNYPLI